MKPSRRRRDGFFSESFGRVVRLYSMPKTFVFSVISFIVFLSCKKKDAKIVLQPVADTIITFPTDTMDTATIFSYLALGDSYTIGESVPEKDRYPVQLTALLNSQSVSMYPPEIIARTGWTTGNLLSRIESDPPQKSTYDIVTLLIGVNNQYQRQPQNEYSEQFTILLKKAIAYAGNKKKRVIVISIPDYSVTPFATGYDRNKIAKEIDEFNTINKNITELNGVAYLYITDHTRLAATDNSLLAADGLHPSGKEYEVWAKRLLPMVKAVLQ